jgi:hypothetical protein
MPRRRPEPVEAAESPENGANGGPRGPHAPFRPGEVMNPNGRPVGSRNRSSNLIVLGLTEALLDLGAEYAAQQGWPSVDSLNDVDKFKMFIRYAVTKDLRSVLALIKPLIPRDVTLTIQQTATVEVLAPQTLLDSLEARGLRLPPTYQLTAGHRNDDDTITEADIVAVVEGESR